MPKDLPPPELLRKLLSYKPDTGRLFWKERSADMFTDGKQTAEHICANWNSRFAGKEAFTTDNGYGYRTGSIFDCTYMAHRVIWAMIHDECPDTIDHINGVRDDNRIENLRSVSLAENLKNQKRYSRNTSGVCGVYWHKRDNKWDAQIRVGGKLMHLGLFTDFDEAVAARKKAEVEHGFHQNHGRDE